MKQFVKNRKYFLIGILDYGKMFEEIGFDDVSAVSITHKHLAELKRELAEFTLSRDQFLQVGHLKQPSSLKMCLAGQPVLECTVGSVPWTMVLLYNY